MWYNVTVVEGLMKLARTIVAACAVSLLFMPRALAEARFVLPHGLAVLAHETKSGEEVAAVLFVNCGDKDAQPGLARLLARAAVKETEKAGDEIELSWRVSPDWTAFYTIVSPRQLDGLIERIGRLFDRSKLEKARWLKWKKLAELEMRSPYENAVQRARDEIMRLLFPDHPYGRYLVSGAFEAAKLGPDELAALYNRYYHPQNAVLSLAGNFKTADALEKLERIEAGAAGRPREPARIDTRRGEYREKRIDLDLAQPVVAFGFRLPGLGHPDEAALLLLARVLAGGLNSRLRALLERHAKTAGAVEAEAIFMEDQGLLLIWAAPAELQSVERTKIEIIRELANLRENGVTEEEWHRARGAAILDRLAAEQDALRFAWMLGAAETAGNWEYARGFPAAAAAMKKSDVERAARSYLRLDNLAHVLLAPPSYRPSADLAAIFSDQLEALESREAMRVDFAARAHPRTDRALVSSLSLLKSPAPQRRGLFDAETYRREVRTPYGTVPPLTTEVMIGPKPEERPKPPPPRKPLYQNVSLPLGMTVLIKEDRTKPFVEIGVFVRAGERREGNKQGLARATAESLFYGTKRRSFKQIATELERLGANFEVSVGSEIASFYMVFPSHNLSVNKELAAALFGHDAEPSRLDQLKRERFDLTAALDLLGDLLSNPSFEPEFLAPAAATARVEEAMARDAPLGLALRVLDGRKPKAQEIIARDEMVSFFESNYLPQNTALVISGDIDGVEAARALAMRFKSYGRYAHEHAGKPAARREIRSRPRAEVTAGCCGTDNFALVLAALRSEKPSDGAALLVLGPLLESRLREALVYEGELASDVSVYAGFRNTAPELLIALAARRDDSGAVEIELKGQLALLAQAPISQAELDRAKGKATELLASRIEIAGGAALSGVEVARLETELAEMRIETLRGAAAAIAGPKNLSLAIVK